MSGTCAAGTANAVRAIQEVCARNVALASTATPSFGSALRSKAILSASPRSFAASAPSSLPSSASAWSNAAFPVP